jgi:glutamate carboxypeptidase
MKGGLTAGIYALKALENADLLKEIPITFVFNSDEEIGSRTSETIIRREARKSLFAFVLECGGLEGEVVTGRKGNMSLTLDTFGKAGHAASAGKDKASAILSLAHKIISMETLNDPERKISVNVGKIAGGIGPNTVPDKATARIDVRYEHPADRRVLENKLTDCAKNIDVLGTKSHLEIVSGRPPMPQSNSNKKLYKIVKKIASQLNIQVQEEFRFGVSDANLIADEGTPVLDGLGPIGADDHSKNEYMIKKSLPERTLLLATALDACWKRLSQSTELLS